MSMPLFWIMPTACSMVFRPMRMFRVSPFSIFFSFFSFGSLSFWISFSLWATVSPFFTMVSSTCFCSSFGTLSNARA